MLGQRHALAGQIDVDQQRRFGLVRGDGRGLDGRCGRYGRCRRISWSRRSCRRGFNGGIQRRQGTLVQRLRDTTDERRVLLRLTAAGRKLKARATAVPPAVAQASGCALGELASLTARLQTLRQELNDSTPRAA